MKIVGLTGSIASGKSTVSAMLRTMRIPVICADALAREVVKPGKPAYRKIVKTFGKIILRKDGKINRQRLGAVVFSDNSSRLQLNAIVHPAVMKEQKEKLKRFKKEGKKLVVLDIPLLFETGMDKLCDTTVVVYAPEAAMTKRLMARDKISKEDARKRVASQMSIEEKKKRADFVIDNAGRLEKIKQQVNNWVQKMRLLELLLEGELDYAEGRYEKWSVFKRKFLKR